MSKQFSFPLHLTPDVIEDLTYEKLLDLIDRQAKEVYKRKEAEFGEDALRQLEKFVYLQMIDTLWKEHLLNMDHMKEGIGLRGYAQKDPLREYKKEGYDMFTDLVNRISSEVIEKFSDLRRVEDILDRHVGANTFFALDEVHTMPSC